MGKKGKRQIETGRLRKTDYRRKKAMKAGNQNFTGEKFELLKISHLKPSWLEDNELSLKY